MKPHTHAGFCYAFWTGLTLMNFALLLHPMDPLDFLAQFGPDPLGSLRDSYGFGAAALFWIGVAGFVSGALGASRRRR